MEWLRYVWIQLLIWATLCLYESEYRCHSCGCSDSFPCHPSCLWVARGRCQLCTEAREWG
jgi:hypothetical protein